MYILGIDIGGTKCATVVGEWNGKDITVINKAVLKTDHGISAENMLEAIFDMANGILTAKPDAIGISCGGPLDSQRGVIMSPPNLPGWDNVEIVRLTKERFGAPTYLQNDANASAIAEWKFGAGRGCKNMAFLTFGTGLGAGLILDGKLYDGTNGNAGEVGHVRLDEDGPIGFGKNGSFEGFCSGGGIARLGCLMAKEAIKIGVRPSYYENEDDSAVSAKSIAEAAKEGDETAKEVYRISGEKLGKGLALMIDTLNPERIIIGGVYARSSDLLVDSMLAELKKEALKESLDCCRILPAELGESIGDYAAMAVAVNGASDSKRDGLIERYPVLHTCKSEIDCAKQMLIDCYESGGKLLLCGNGGSAADCDHIVGELMKGFMSKRPLSSTQREKMSERCEDLRDETLSKLQNALPAISLTSFNSLNTAFSNDVDADLVFAQSVFGLGKTNDVLIAISTSGNSKNVLEAARVARSIGLKVIALTGRDGGALARIADVTIRVPEDETYRIQELHLPVYHYLCAEIEKHFFG